MAEFWLISAPGDRSPQQTWEKCKVATKDLSLNYKLILPELKVGTLDTLVGLSDDLGKLDAFVESIVKKVAGYTVDVLEEKQDKVMENLQVNRMDPATYLTKFQWDSAKYPIKQPLRNLAEIISKQVTQIDADLKTKANAYNTVKGSLQSLERKATGSLMTRNLNDIVKKENFVLGSEYLSTLLVVVPKSQMDDWKLAYEKLTDMVVPRSSKLLYEDGENGLFSVTLFKKVVDEFKLHAREKKFVVRDFVYDEEELAASKNEISRLTSDKKKLFGPLVKWLRVNFGESFIAWIHVKALRVFVESVLRYGLPVNFQAMLLQPNKGKTRKLRDVLLDLYAHLDSQASKGTQGDVDIPGLMLGQREYYPYVCFNIKLNIFER
ncbi:V-type proton ATPase subunit C 1-B-like [Rhopilema esculentum]|uniref:V-type proton ATPase subunit C 1-B-like n=1 Tax=Rhopilema esculentum TaxID=499914 RepID=UPI0031D35316